MSDRNRIHPQKIDSDSDSHLFDDNVSEKTQNGTILGIFVVMFDNRKGSMLEWSYPNELDFSGVEKFSLYTGCHKVHMDSVYFKYKNFYGLSCFQRLESKLNHRGCEMISVGILSSTFIWLRKHVQFLVKKSLEMCEKKTNLIQFNNDKYSKLEEYYIKNRCIITTNINLEISLTEHLSIYHGMDTSNDFECLLNLDTKIFTIWKLAITCNRLLFYDDPPLCNLNKNVFATFLMMNGVPSERISNSRQQNVNFFVDVTCINELKKSFAYLASTTDRLLCTKHKAYDVLILTNGECKTTLPHLKHICSNKKNYRDVEKLNKLKMEIKDIKNQNVPINNILFTYFTTLNKHLFTHLQTWQEWANSNSGEHILTKSEISDKLHLDPYYDYQFLLTIFELYSFDIAIKKICPCC
ncbi:hypothetical protein A3Q56_04082 [Intoshia linei]|uniref:Protein LCHN n=1 Tax=Intoshia linei TaxID=1819745 RepID=A0A177B1K8_9BILA|nr:hypothetical protein A3Q56_04082 [Intoshia linei]